MSDRLRVTRRQTAMTRVTTDDVAEMTQEQRDAFLVNINDERIRENNILGTRMGEIEGEVANQLKSITDTLELHGNTLSQILSLLQASGFSGGVGGGASAATGAGSSATGATRSSGMTSRGPRGLSGGTGRGLRMPR